MKKNPIYFLVWGCPWPGFSGGALRNQGLLVEASKCFPIDLVVFYDEPMTDSQRTKCLEFSRRLIEIPLRRKTIFEKVMIITLALAKRIPFHASAVELSLRKHPIREALVDTKRVVFCSPPHFAVIAKERMDASAWILGQHDADVDQWRIVASEERNPLRKAAAMINMTLSSHFYKKIYEKVGCVISVCEEDASLTNSLSKKERIEVIENGVDCSYFRPNRKKVNNGAKKILFTGTSSERNMIALRYFMRDILPHVRNAVPDVEFIAGGDFDSRAQSDLKRFGDVHFTGRIEDIRPVYDDCDVSICPYKEECYGSKLKISQALAMGICVVTTLAGARGFPLSDHENALVAETDDIFITYIKTALSQSDLRDKLGNNGRKLALEHLDWSVLGKRIRDIIADLQV